MVALMPELAGCVVHFVVQLGFVKLIADKAAGKVNQLPVTATLVVELLGTMKRHAVKAALYLPSLICCCCCVEEVAAEWNAAVALLAEICCVFSYESVFCYVPMESMVLCSTVSCSSTLDKVVPHVRGASGRSRSYFEAFAICREQQRRNKCQHHAQANHCKSASPNNYQYSLPRHQHQHNTPSNHFRDAISSIHIPSAATDPVVQPHQQASCNSSTNLCTHTTHYNDKIRMIEQKSGRHPTRGIRQSSSWREDKSGARTCNPAPNPTRTEKLSHTNSFDHGQEAPRPHKTTESSATTSKEMPSHSISK
ncbi:hypothetical protein Nepgr_021054 [Nepenthes gracilis]|uniref:Uncharacterized protein n=1 Tax=Nepenthes gracilis TaxID=150966 RepID=A0AAD3XVT1_NEPGR|nr:hypothetical protein Nepgr_021054 [Nepenthes gracilis]